MLLLSCILLLYVFAVFKSSKYLFIYLPLLWLLPAYLYYLSLYQTAPDEQIFSIVLETNFQEAWHFLGAKVYWYLAFNLVWIIYTSCLVYHHFQRPMIWQHRSRYWVLIGISAYLALTYGLNAQIADEINQQINSDQQKLQQEKNQFLQEIKKTYPIGMLISIHDLIQQQQKINQAFEQNRHFKFNAFQNQTTEKKQIYVLVLGETSRRENWQLNGYHRNTNPLLSQQKNLVNFSNMLSLSSTTRSAIPMMLTRKPDHDVHRYDFKEKSIIAAFKEAGFSTYWLSTQQKFGPFDSSTSVYAKEADEIIFLNKAKYSEAGDLDTILLAPLQKILNRPEAKQFIVLHTLGSHYNYKHRYPIEFNYFKPSLHDVSGYSLQERKFQPYLLNSYDNSILFTDYFLDQTIGLLAQHQDAISFLVYSSDHGEDLFDQGCHQSGHGLQTQRNFEIAGFAWYSAQFEKKFTEKVRYLYQNKDQKMNHTSIFPTLLDAANIDIPNANLERSVLRPFKHYSRIIDGSIDYDQAQVIGICKEIK